MNLTEEFKSEFTCEAPEFLPATFAKRLVFHSCLAKSKDRIIYLVYDKDTHKKSILKIALPDSTNNLKREYEILSKLSHPGIPAAISFEVDAEDREYLLRDYAEGEMLSTLLERDGVFSTHQTLEITMGICDILAYLHNQTPPIIYRDISPWNIILTPNGKLSLIDFGISREEKKHQTFDTQVVGNVAFASPENFGFAQTDPRSDIFALGKLMLYLSTGDSELPHYEKRVSSPDFRKIIEKCTRLSPEKRYSSVERLSRDIRRVLNPPTRRELWATVLGAVLVIFAGTVLWGTLHSPETVAPDLRPLSAGGLEALSEDQIPVFFQVEMNGAPYSHCVVAVDNHHWYIPKNGKAQLTATPHDNYRVRVAEGNRTAIADASVSREGEPLQFTFELADLPQAPDYLSLSVPRGTRTEISLGIAGADEVVLGEHLNGISVVQKDGDFLLVVEESVEVSGHYAIFMESTNEYGKADTMLGLEVYENQPVTMIRTVAELDAVRNDLTGHYRLSNDIDLMDFGNWTPIGTPEQPFTGRFDGGGFHIKNMSIFGSNRYGGVFGAISCAVVENIIVATPDIQINPEDRGELAAIVGHSDRGLIQNCAVLGGKIVSDVYGFDSSIGGICGFNGGILRACINTVDITVTDHSRSGRDSMAGGICGTNSGYITDCGNTGKVSGAVLAGGVSGFNDAGILTRCYSAGLVTAPNYAGDYPAGGIVHLLGRGKSISYSAFETGTAPVGATVWNGGTLLGLVPIEKADFSDFDAISRVFNLNDVQDLWEYTELVPGYPVPKGIF